MIHAGKLRELAYLAQTRNWERLLRQMEKAAQNGASEVTFDMPINAQQQRCLEARGFAVRGFTVHWGQFGQPTKVVNTLAITPDIDQNSGHTLKQALDAYEKQLLSHALKEHKTKTRAAQALGINRTTLIEKLRKHGM